jgi:hypothetical protein
MIVNVDTGQPLRWSDSCVRRGATVGFDPPATAEATKVVKQFLDVTFEASILKTALDCRKFGDSRQRWNPIVLSQTMICGACHPGQYV